MSGLDEIPGVNLEEFKNIIENRKNECLAEGHKEVYWITEFIPYGTREVLGGCNYCLTPMKRVLNRDEWDAQKRFYNSMKDPMDI